MRLGNNFAKASKYILCKYINIFISHLNTFLIFSYDQYKIKIYLLYLVVSLYQAVSEKEGWKEKWRHANGAE